MSRKIVSLDSKSVLPVLVLKNEISESDCQVSNISDAGYLGIAKVAGFLGPLLQDPTDNKHATLITLFMNAVQEIYEDFKQDPKTVKSELTRVMQYRLPVAPRLSQHDAQATLNVAAMDLVRDGDRFFKR